MELIRINHKNMSYAYSLIEKANLTHLTLNKVLNRCFFFSEENRLINEKTITMVGMARARKKLKEECHYQT